MAITRSNSQGNVTGSAASSLTYSYNMTGSTDTLLVVGIGNNGTVPTDNVSGVTFNGVALTRAPNTAQFGGSRPVSTYIYYGTGFTGTANIVISLTLPDDIFAATASYEGVDTNLDGSDGQRNNASATASTTITSSANGWQFSVGNSWDGFSSWTNATNLTTVNGIFHSGDTNGPITGSTTITYTATSTNGSTISTVAFKPSAAVVASSINRGLNLLGVGQ